MGKMIFHKTGVVVLALLVLFSTFSFTISAHYCGNTLVDISLFSKADNCGMELPRSTDKESITKKPCCSDETIVFEGSEELLKSSLGLSQEQQVFVATFVYTHLALLESAEIAPGPYEGYPPPLLVHDIQLLDEVFLI